MSNRSPVCALFLTLAACVPAQPEDTGGRSRADSDSNGAEDTHTGDTDTGDTAAERTCADLPWKQVELGWDFGCGIHTDGCVECWGSDTLYRAIYEEPEVEAQFVAVHDQAYHDYENRDYPSACVIGTDQRLTCWALHPYHVVHETTEPVVDVVLGDYGDLAVLSAKGVMTSQWGRLLCDPISGVGAPVLMVGDTRVGATQNGRFTYWDERSDCLEETDHGPVDAWSWYGDCDESWCALSHDGAGWVLADSVGWREVFAADRGWVAFFDHYADYLVQDAAGFVYEYDDTTGIASTTPWFTEPVVSVSSVQSASCGITADGWLECTGDMKDRFPPPGSYVLPR